MEPVHAFDGIPDVIACKSAELKVPPIQVDPARNGQSESIVVAVVVESRLHAFDRIESGISVERVGTDHGEIQVGVYDCPDLPAFEEPRPVEDRPGHVSVVVVPGEAIEDPAERQALLSLIESYFDDKRLLTTRVHVAEADYLGDEQGMEIHLAVILKPGALEDTLTFSIAESALDLEGVDPTTPTGAAEMMSQLLDHARNDPDFSRQHQVSDDVSFRILTDKKWLIIDNEYRQTYTMRKEDTHLYMYKDALRTQAIRTLHGFFDPLKGGPDGTGWPFGRDVYVSEVYQKIDTLPGVDYANKIKDPDSGLEIDELSVSEPKYANRRIYNEANRLVALAVLENELVRLKFDSIHIIVQRNGNL